MTATQNPAQQWQVTDVLRNGLGFMVPSPRVRLASIGIMSFTIPIRLIAASNAREHWRVVAQRKKAQRELGAMWTRGVYCELTLPGRVPGRFIVTITRIGKRKMDDDNLAGSAKYLRDGIADGLRVDDGDASRVVWRYEQEIGKGYAVRVAIEVEP